MTVREFLENIREKLRRLFFLNVPVTKEELEEKKEELLQMIAPPSCIHSRSKSSCRNSSTGIPPEPTMMAWRGLKGISFTIDNRKGISISKNRKDKFSKVGTKILDSYLRNSQK